MKQSIWAETCKLPTFEKLDYDIKTDILIIGGGICGLLCAYYLQLTGVDCVVVEGKNIASGTTGKTTAKITCQHGIIYDKLLKNFGREQAIMYYEANSNAVAEYEKLCTSMGCNFEKKNAYVYSPIDREKIENEAKAALSLGIDAEFVSKVQLPFATAGAVCFKNQGQINPLNFINGIVKGLRIYEHTFVKEITDNCAVTDHGTIRANKIIVATHFPFINKHGGYFLKLYQHRSYMTAYEIEDKFDGMYVDENLNGLSFRTYKNLLIVGGGGHRTGKRGSAWEDIEKAMKQYYPRAKIKFQWSAQDCISLDGVPYIGRYSKKSSDIYVATGFNKWGFTSSMVAAKMLRDMVVGEKNEYAPIFSPQRTVLKPQLMINGFESAINLLTPSLKRCPHMGCALKWNSAEKSWDCPCHGSRFTESGKLIDNPATKSAKIIDN